MTKIPKNKAYLSGPMTGYKDHNARAFNFYAAKLRKKGYEVLSPIDMDAGRINIKWEEAIKRDIKAMLDCDIVATLPDWWKSRGARLEVFVAGTVGMPVVNAIDLLR